MEIGAQTPALLNSLFESDALHPHRLRARSSSGSYSSSNLMWTLGLALLAASSRAASSALALRSRRAGCQPTQPASRAEPI
jgi:hypothetical protein